MNDVTQQANCPFLSSSNNTMEFILKLILHANTVAVNIASELIRHDDMPSDDKEDYDNNPPRYLLQDIARAKDAQFVRGKRLKDDCIDKLDAAITLIKEIK